tara:strand:- start:217 stop:2973 length:2757 start_codon:yes stop_codon:yes gene_type:complete
MVRNILNQSGIKVYNNTLDNGEATEIIQVGNTTQTKCNVSFKTNTSEETNSDENDLILLADNSSGKILRYSTIRNMHNSLIWKDVDKTTGTGRNVILVNSTNNNVVIGPDSNNNANNRRLLVVGSSGQVALEVYKDSVFRDGTFLILNDGAFHLASNSTFRYIFTRNNGLTANRNINIPLLSNDGTMMIDETNVGLKLVNNIIKSNANNDLINALTSNIFSLGNTTDELRLTSKATGVKLMPNQLLDSSGLNLLSKASNNYFIGSGTSNYMELASGAVRLLNNQLSDNGGGSFINKTSTLITLGNTSNTLVLESLATGVQVSKGILFTGANNNLISTVGSVTTVAYPSNTYTQLNGAHVRLGSNILNDSAGVNLLSKSGTTITIGSAEITTTINGTFQSTDIAFLNVAAGASKKLYYTFSGSATEYDFLKITRDASTDADSIINVGNTTHRIQFNASTDGGITLNTQGGFKNPAGKNIMKYTEALGVYSQTINNGFDDLNIDGADITVSATSLGSPTQFLIANTNGVTLGSDNKKLTLRGNTANGIQIDTSLRNPLTRVILDYDSLNTTNIFGSTSTDKSNLRGTSIDLTSIGDIDFFVSDSHPFDTYKVKIDSTGNIKFDNDSGIAQAIKTRANNNLIGINSAGNTIDVGNTANACNVNSSGAVNLYQNGGTTLRAEFSNGNIKLINDSGSAGALVGSSSTISKFTTQTRMGNVHCYSVYADNALHLSNGFWRSFGSGDHSYIILDARYLSGSGANRDVVRFSSDFSTQFYLNSGDSRRFEIVTSSANGNTGTAQFVTSGGSTFVVDTTSGSERRFKQNITELDKENSLEIITRLKPSSYQFIEEPNETKTGFIVDEVEQVFPEMVFSTEVTMENGDVDNRKGIFKKELIPTMVSAIQKLTEKVNHLEQIIQNNNLS